MSKRVFAVRIGDCVEFRLASVPLKAIVSKLTIPTKREVTRWVPDPPKKPLIGTEGYDYMSYFRGHYEMAWIETKTVLKQVFHTGGKVLGTMKLTKFQAYSKKYKLGTLLKGKTMELKPPFSTLVTSPAWRKENL